MENLLQIISQKHNLGVIVNTNILRDNENIIYKMITTQNEYIIKIYNKDVIRNNDDLNKRINQIKASELYLQNGINVILPIKITDTYFGYENDYYYLIYPNYNYQITSPDLFTPTKLSVLAQTIAKMHQLNIKASLPCAYQKVKISFNNILKNIKDEETKQTLKNSIPFLKTLINSSNKELRIAKKNLCLSHNDLKPQNLLWNADILYLTNFDSCEYVNPYCDLINCAYNISKQTNQLNLDYYHYFIKNYLLINKLDIDIEKIINASMNCKLQYFKHLLEKEESLERNNDIKSMINELSLFFHNKNQLIIPFKN